MITADNCVIVLEFVDPFFHFTALKKFKVQFKLIATFYFWGSVLAGVIMFSMLHSLIAAKYDFICA